MDNIKAKAPQFKQLHDSLEFMAKIKPSETTKRLIDEINLALHCIDTMVVLMGAFDVGQQAGDTSAIGVGRQCLRAIRRLNG